VFQIGEPFCVCVLGLGVLLVGRLIGRRLITGETDATARN
jgi:hypothetical protein